MRRSGRQSTLPRCCASFGIVPRRPRTSVSTESTFTRPPRPSAIPCRSQFLIHSTQSARSGGSLSVRVWRGGSWEVGLQKGGGGVPFFNPPQLPPGGARPIHKPKKPSQSGGELPPPNRFMVGGAG